MTDIRGYDLGDQEVIDIQNEDSEMYGYISEVEIPQKKAECWWLIVVC